MPTKGDSPEAGRQGRALFLGKGLAVAILLLAAVECWLHTDHFLYRFRSVFAAGRALDKAAFAERHCPHLLILGNSRADNGFDPKTLMQSDVLPEVRSAFNLGIPGADSRILFGLLDRIDRAGCVGQGGTRRVVLVLDESLVQSHDTLGQEVFFANRRQMLADGQLHDALRSLLRLYGFSANLRQLREPGTLQRFLLAARRDVPPLGGGAGDHLGYRAGFGGLQDAASAARQETEHVAPPSPVNVRYLWRMLDRLASRGVQVAVAFPPLLHRDVLYRSAPGVDTAPYRAIADELARRGVPLLALDDGKPRSPAEFVNAGHLNDRGAQRYSRLLAFELQRARMAAGTAPGSHLGEGTR